MEGAIRLIVIDDEVLMERLFEGMFWPELNDGRLDLLFFSDPQEGLSFLQDSQAALSHEPAVLITDINMPGMTGMELIRRLTFGRLVDFRIFVISAYDKDFVWKDLKNLPIEGFYRKPVDFFSLRHQILGNATAVLN